jgi:hypothetical protein
MQASIICLAPFTHHRSQARDKYFAFMEFDMGLEFDMGH